jgi:hypothetical protein
MDDEFLNKSRIALQEYLQVMKILFIIYYNFCFDFFFISLFFYLFLYSLLASQKMYTLLESSG